MLTDKQRREFEAEIARTHPQLDPYFIKLLLDVYQSNAPFVEGLAKKHKAKPPCAAKPKALVQKSIEVLKEYEWPEQDSTIFSTDAKAEFQDGPSCEERGAPTGA